MKETSIVVVTTSHDSCRIWCTAAASLVSSVASENLSLSVLVVAVATVSVDVAILHKIAISLYPVFLSTKYAFVDTKPEIDVALFAARKSTGDIVLRQNDI